MAVRQLSLNLGRCERRSAEGWRCTKWVGRHKEHTALAPSGWHPDYAIQLSGRPNVPVGKGISPWTARQLSDYAHGAQEAPREAPRTGEEGT